MDNNLVTISKVKDNVLEFNVIVKGIEETNMSVNFIIEADEMNLSFNSEKGKGEDDWSVKIPALSMLETTSYPFHIDVIVDGYHFEMSKGSITVVGSHDIYISKPENITLTPAKKKASVKEIVKRVETHKLEPKKAVEKEKEKVATVIKPNRRFEMKPLKVKDGKELFKTLINPKPERVYDTQLDDKIVNLMKMAKTEQKAAEQKAANEKKKEIESKKIEAKKEVEPEEKITVKKPSVKKAKKKVKKLSASSKKIIYKGKEKSTKSASAKKVAEQIIQAVTGLGGKKEEVIKEKTKDDKIKDIIMERTSVTKVKKSRKKAIRKEASGIRKITKDKIIVEVDESKEQNIKNVLKEIDKK